MDRHSVSGRTFIAFALAAACASSVPASAATILVLNRSLPPRIADAKSGAPALRGWVVELLTVEPTRSAGLKR